MSTFKVEKGVTLHLEVEADDAESALKLVDGAFSREDPLMHANVRTPRLHPLILGIARVVDALPTGEAKVATHEDGKHRRKSHAPASHDTR